MPFPVIGAVAIGVSIGSKLLGNSARKRAEKARADALKGNALVQLANTLSGLSAREAEELAAARQQKRLGRRQSAVLEARAKAGGAESGTGSAEQVQDVLMGKAEFLGSVDAQLGMVTDQLRRQRSGAKRSFDSAIKAADAGLSGPGQDFLDFANTAAFALNAWDALPTAKSSPDSIPTESVEI
jgi:hypothetical protein